MQSCTPRVRRMTARRGRVDQRLIARRVDQTACDEHPRTAARDRGEEGLYEHEEAANDGQDRARAGGQGASGAEAGEEAGGGGLAKGRSERRHAVGARSRRRTVEPSASPSGGCGYLRLRCVNYESEF